MKFPLKKLLFLLLPFCFIGCNEITVTQLTPGRTVPAESMIMKSWNETRPEFTEVGSFVFEAVAMNDDEAFVIFSTNAYISGSYEYSIYGSHYENGIWTHPDESEPIVSGGEISGIHFSLSKNGHGLLMWKDYSADTFKAANYKSGIWNRPYIIGSAYKNYTIAQSDNGRAVVAWEGDNTAMVDRYNSESSSWGGEEEIFMQDSDYLSEVAAIKINDDGDIISMFTNRSYQIYFVQYKNGVWITPADRDDTLTDYALGSKLALNNSGQAVFTWYDDNTHEMNFGRYSGSSWSFQTRPVSDHLNPYEETVTLGLKNNGDAIVSWDRNEYATYSSGSWTIKNNPEAVRSVLLKETSQFEYTLFTNGSNSTREYSCTLSSCQFQRNIFGETDLISFSPIIKAQNSFLYQIVRKDGCYNYTDLVEIRSSNTPYVFSSYGENTCAN